MQRSRTVAGTPRRSAREAWQVIVTLIGDTLERSPAVPDDSVATELAPIGALGAAMIASDLLADHPLILTAGELQLDITVRIGDDGFNVDENLDPVLGGASAPSDWVLHLPAAGRTADAAAAAAAGSDHLAVGAPAPASPKNAEPAAKGTQIDVDALRRLGGR